MYRPTALSAVVSVLAAPATAASKDTCTSHSTKVTQLEIKDFEFHASWAISNLWGHINFTLINTAVNYTYQCSTTSDRLDEYFYGNCTGPSGRATNTATFAYSHPAQTLAINQTWACPEGSKFWAETGAELPLICEETKYQNPNWTFGNIYSGHAITCDKLTQGVSITSLSAAA